MARLDMRPSRDIQAGQRRVPPRRCIPPRTCTPTATSPTPASAALRTSAVAPLRHRWTGPRGSSRDKRSAGGIAARQRRSASRPRGTRGCPRRVPSWSCGASAWCCAPPRGTMCTWRECLEKYRTGRQCLPLVAEGCARVCGAWAADPTCKNRRWKPQVPPAGCQPCPPRLIWRPFFSSVRRPDCRRSLPTVASVSSLRNHFFCSPSPSSCCCPIFFPWQRK